MCKKIYNWLKKWTKSKLCQTLDYYPHQKSEICKFTVLRLSCRLACSSEIIFCFTSGWQCSITLRAYMRHKIMHNKTLSFLLSEHSRRQFFPFSYAGVRAHLANEHWVMQLIFRSTLVEVCRRLDWRALFRRIRRQVPHISCNQMVSILENLCCH